CAVPSERASARTEVVDECQEITAKGTDSAGEMLKLIRAVESSGGFLLHQVYKHPRRERAGGLLKLHEAADRSALGRLVLDRNELHAVTREEFLQRLHRVVAEMLLVDVVDDAVANQVREVPGFEHEHATGREQATDAVDEVLEIVDVRKHVIGGDDRRRSVITPEIVRECRI